MFIKSKNSNGVIRTLKDGIADISGLTSVQSGELVISNNNYGLVLNLQKNYIGVVFMSEENLKVGSNVQRLYDLISISTSVFLLGQVVNALGIDFSFENYKKPGLAVQNDPTTRQIEIKAPGIIGRQSVYESLNTGSKIIDSIVPIGLGQRELVIGDRQTGKTAIVIDAILLKTTT